jgi:hypothetical protein
VTLPFAIVVSAAAAVARRLLSVPAERGSPVVSDEGTGVGSVPV